ncbi:hypothetical protein CASFOL_039410 [Castilleja foliolosa]|uniref:Rho termination factor-like N-terminal domain-containing protein n=1 Tax=Castilleja foliolosa TaxID=1961234 RepID=A0ABD3BHW4_9LAMI
MGGSALYSHPLLPHYSSFSTSSTPNFRKSFLISLKGLFNLAEIRGVDAKSKGPNGNNSQPLDGRSSSSSSSNKEEILALFKRIQSSISKGDDSKKRNSKDSVFEALHQSRTPAKGKKVGKKGEKQKDSPKKEDEKTDRSSITGLKSTRPPSSFTRRSPIPTQPIPGNETEPENSEHVVDKFEEMKLAELKKVAKCNGIKGYSKLKKSELLELLIRSLGNTTS